MTRIFCFFLLLLFMRASHAQEEAMLLGTWSDPELVGSNLYNNIYNEVWGITYGGREYGIIGSTAGTHFIDVTYPANAFEAHFVAGASQGGQIIHRDYHDKDGYLYAVSDEGSSSLQIIDFKGLPDAVDVVYDSDDLIEQAHNIFIEDNTLYAFATENPSMGSYALRLFDISSLVSPQFVAEYNVFGDLEAGHVHDGYLRNHIAFLNCGGDGMAIVDFSDRLSPITLFTLKSYPQQGYNHSGWLSDDGAYYYMADENHATDLKILDVSDPCNTTVEGTFNAGVSNPFSITHNQIAACDYLYTSYYYDGLQVFDISDPEDPQKVFYYDTYPGDDAQNYRGAWGVYPLLPSGNILVSDMQSGLHIIQGPGDQCHSLQAVENMDVSCAVSLSTEDPVKAASWHVFPQPAVSGSSLNIIGFGDIREMKMELFSSGGTAVIIRRKLSIEGGKAHLDLPTGLSPGAYFIRLSDGNADRVLPISIF